MTNIQLQNVVLISFMLTSMGCAGGMGAANRRDGVASMSNGWTHPQVERGKPQPVIDGIGWVVGIPSKILLWDSRINNHHVSPDTEAAIAQYVDELGLDETKVRINQYAPIDEWRRLTANREVAWGWRYTFGAFTWAGETILPGRVFGGDRYNPYSNTISIYSDAPAMAVKEGGRARDYRSRSMPGTYAVVNSLPVVSMWHETVATNYAFEYLHNNLPESEREGYHLLYPEWGSHLGGDISRVAFSPGYAFGEVAGAITGHIVGRYRGRNVPEDGQETSRAQTPELAHQ